MPEPTTEIIERLHGKSGKSDIWRTLPDIVMARNSHGIMVADARGAIHFANQAAASILECATSDLLGRNCLFLALSDEPVAGSFAGPKGRFISATIQPLRSENQPEKLWLICLHDITERRSAEEKLRKSEQILTEAQRLAHFGSWEWHVENGTMVWSDELYRIFGLDPTKVSPSFENFLELVHFEDRQRMSRLLKKVCSGKRHFNSYLRIVRQDGTARIIHGRGRMLADASGRPVSMVGSCQDVTEARNAETALRISEHKFSRAFQATPSILIISTLESGRYIEVNEAFERLLEYRRDQVVGRTFRELDIWQTPDDRERLLQMLARGIKVRDREVVFRRKSGGTLIGLYSAEIIEVDGEKCLLSLINDITDRKKAEEALRRNEERFRTIFSNTSTGVSITGPDRRFLAVNPALCRLLGYSQEELLRMRIDDISLPGDQGNGFHLRPNAADRTAFDAERRCLRKDGTTIWVQISANWIFESTGRPLYAVSIIQDISGRKLAEEEVDKLTASLAARATELEEANRELDAFNYTVAHDLQIPLTTISGYSDLVVEMCSPSVGKQCVGYIQEIQDATQRMSRLVETLLGFSRITRAEMHRERISLSELARFVATRIAEGEPERRVHFNIAEGVMVDGDTNLLQIVMENLLGNAWKYTALRKVANIDFGVTEIEGETVYFVRDNGTGFDSEQAHEIFIPFRRLAESEGYKGHGIGLATVERIIRRHGGKVWAEGMPGVGATFYFTLPRAEPKPASRRPAAQPTPAPV